MLDEARLRTLLDLLHGPDLAELAALRGHLARRLRGERWPPVWTERLQNSVDPAQ